jgi:hypothetical protein
MREEKNADKAPAERGLRTAITFFRLVALFIHSQAISLCGDEKMRAHRFSRSCRIARADCLIDGDMHLID